MTMILYQVDAFADRLFEGNPAAVVPLDAWLDDALMLRIAAENNLAETAFFVPEDDGYRLRWFTPTVEVDLCGHATLAAAHVLFTSLGYDRPDLPFETRSGRLTVTRATDGLLAMDFPALPIDVARAPDGFWTALGAGPVDLFQSNNFLAVFETADEIAALAPDFAGLGGVLAPFNACVIATAPADAGTGWDFVSRFFAPAHGVNEDAVTGSAHCTLAPYWAARLGKADLVARQISARGGTVYCTHLGERVVLRGRCADYLRGEVVL